MSRLASDEVVVVQARVRTLDGGEGLSTRYARRVLRTRLDGYVTLDLGQMFVDAHGKALDVVEVCRRATDEEHADFCAARAEAGGAS